MKTRCDTAGGEASKKERASFHPVELVLTHVPGSKGLQPREPINVLCCPAPVPVPYILWPKVISAMIWTKLHIYNANFRHSPAASEAYSITAKAAGMAKVVPASLCNAFCCFAHS